MLYDIPTAVLIGLLLVVLVGVVEVGMRVGARRGHTTWSNAHDVHTALTGATLALMGLMLAFTFNMSAARFDARKSLIVSEASAIQSVRGGLDFLAPAPRAQAELRLDDYLGLRIAFLEVGHDPARERATIDQARRTHRVLWRIATVPGHYATTDPQVRGVQYSQLTAALIELRSVALQREAARARRVPEAVLFLLFALAIGAGGIVAYISGASGHPDRLPTYIVLLLVCLVIYMIIDFDRPRRGLMRLDAGPLRNLIVARP